MYGTGYSYYYRGRHQLQRARCPDCSGTGARLSANSIVTECTSCKGSGLYVDPELRRMDLIVAGVVTAIYLLIIVSVFVSGGFK